MPILKREENVEGIAESKHQAKIGTSDVPCSEAVDDVGGPNFSRAFRT